MDKYEEEGTDSIATDVDASNTDAMKVLVECASVCSQSRIIEGEKGRVRVSVPKGRFSRRANDTRQSVDMDEHAKMAFPPSNVMLKIYGDATEVGILRYCCIFLNPMNLRQRVEKVHEIPFNSMNKFHLMVVRRKENDQRIAYLKGAPERVLRRCKEAIGGTFEERLPVDDAYMTTFMQAYESLSAHGLRSIAFAYCNVSSRQSNYDDMVEGKEFTMIGMIGLYDPPKEGVKEAIDTCKRAGIQVVMVTGDHPFTAEAIARQVHILEKPLGTLDASSEVSEASPNHPSSFSLVINGDDIDAMTPSQWNQALTVKEVVFARTLPRHKLEIVQIQAFGSHCGSDGRWCQ